MILSASAADLAQANVIAARAIAGDYVDPTDGADSYYAASAPEPYWAKGLEPCAVIGAHRFYRTRDSHA